MALNPAPVGVRKKKKWSNLFLAGLSTCGRISIEIDSVAESSDLSVLVLAVTCDDISVVVPEEK